MTENEKSAPLDLRAALERLVLAIEGDLYVPTALEGARAALAAMPHADLIEYAWAEGYKHGAAAGQPGLDVEAVIDAVQATVDEWGHKDDWGVQSIYVSTLMENLAARLSESQRRDSEQ